MKITEMMLIRTCIDGALVKEMKLDLLMDKDFVFYLGELGQIQYFADLKDPFFRIESPGSLVIRGIQNTDILRVRLEGDVVESENRLVSHVGNYGVCK